MINKIEAASIALLVWVVFLILAAAGWVMNILNLLGANGEITGTLILQAIGIIVVPLGAIMGWVV